MKLNKCVFVSLFSLATVFSHAQGTWLNNRLIKLGVSSIRKIDNTFFKEYFEVSFEQPVDHKNPKAGKFMQRFTIGFNDTLMPTVLETDGNGFEWQVKKGYINELAYRIKGNMVVVEHRYFGKSIPEKPDWKYCTIEQNAADVHAIKEFVSKMFKGKWLLYGSGRSGQAALAYKMNFPDDVDGTVVMGTPVRKPSGDSRLDEFMKKMGATKCGGYIEKFQQEMLDRKAAMLPVFTEFITQKKFTYTKTNLDIEALYDYCVLYYSFCFWQGGFACVDIPIPDSHENIMVRELVKVVSPRYYSDESIERLRASHYLMYSQLAPYELITTPFKGKLKLKDYSNTRFLPEGIKPKFNSTYLEELNGFLKKSKARNIIFIYGENDPWASMQVDVVSENGQTKYIIPNGSNVSMLKELKPEHLEELAKTVGGWIGVNLKSK
ncbi:MAG TPA: S28 family serine protease [Flavobacteriales bacterium]|nr:S28 family serine protease [Flavobacteriales bacterium]